MQIRLDGKTVLVTGASSGMGAGIAQGLAACGARVAVVGRDRDRLDATVRAVEAAGGEAVAIRSDLTEPGEPQQVVEAAVTALGALNILINAAGIFQVAPFDDSGPLLDRQWEINVRAPFELTRAAMPYLRGGGAVLFLSSIGGRIGFATASAYCSTKGALENLVRVLAVEEAANGVRVNAIAPGNVRTSMNEGLLADPAYEKAMLDQTPAGRIGEIDDVVPAAVFLVSDAASYITGHSLVIDGGWTAR